MTEAEQSTNNALTLVIEEAVYDHFLELQSRIEKYEARIASMIRSAARVAGERNTLWQLLDDVGGDADSVVDRATIAASVMALAAIDPWRLPDGWSWRYLAADSEFYAVNGPPDADDTVAVYYDADGTVAVDGLGCDAAAPDEVHEAVRRRKLGGGR